MKRILLWQRTVVLNITCKTLDIITYIRISCDSFFTIKMTIILIKQSTLSIVYHYTNFVRISFISETNIPMIYAVGNFKHVIASRFVDVHKGWQTNENAHCISIVLVSTVRTMGIIEHAHYDCWKFTQI